MDLGQLFNFMLPNNFPTTNTTPERISSNQPQLFPFFNPSPPPAAQSYANQPNTMMTFFVQLLQTAMVGQMIQQLNNSLTMQQAAAQAPAPAPAPVPSPAPAPASASPSADAALIALLSSMLDQGKDKAEKTTTTDAPAPTPTSTSTSTATRPSPTSSASSGNTLAALPSSYRPSRPKAVDMGEWIHNGNWGSLIKKEKIELTADTINDRFDELEEILGKTDITRLDLEAVLVTRLKPKTPTLLGGTPDDPLLEFVQLLMTNQSDLFNGQRPITRQTLLDKMNRDGNRDTLSMMTFNYRSWSVLPGPEQIRLLPENTERYDDGLPPPDVGNSAYYWLAFHQATASQLNEESNPELLRKSYSLQEINTLGGKLADMIGQDPWTIDSMDDMAKASGEFIMNPNTTSSEEAAIELGFYIFTNFAELADEDGTVKLDTIRAIAQNKGDGQPQTVSFATIAKQRPALEHVMTYNSYKSDLPDGSRDIRYQQGLGSEAYEQSYSAEQAQANFHKLTRLAGQSEVPLTFIGSIAAGAYNSDADLADYADGLTLAMIENGWPVLTPERLDTLMAKDGNANNLTMVLRRFHPLIARELAEHTQNLKTRAEQMAAVAEPSETLGDTTRLYRGEDFALSGGDYMTMLRQDTMNITALNSQNTFLGTVNINFTDDDSPTASVYIKDGHRLERYTVDDHGRLHKEEALSVWDHVTPDNPTWQIMVGPNLNIPMQATAHYKAAEDGSGMEADYISYTIGNTGIDIKPMSLAGQTGLGPLATPTEVKTTHIGIYSALGRPMAHD
ncbi:MAG: hypothetical protein KC476_04865 [Cyanobacteria bacterium HKST-UBA06]|nr:hypothetical protein [Cyanobacteria bacterium HKST-UBA06]